MRSELVISLKLKSLRRKSMIWIVRSSSFKNKFLIGKSKVKDTMTLPIKKTKILINCSKQ
jgi:hypothetical protein